MNEVWGLTMNQLFSILGSGLRGIRIQVQQILKGNI